VTICIRASGAIDLPCQLILRGQSVAATAVENFGKVGVGLTATFSGTQSDDTLQSYLEELLPKIGTTKSNPAILEADGHSTRKTEAVIALCEKYNVYFVLQPSHTSTMIAPLDNGVNALFEKFYNETYTSSVTALAPVISNLLQAMEKLQNTDVEKIKACWRKCFQPNGKIDV